MAGYLLDTNHISPLVTYGHPLRARILPLLQAEDPPAIPTPALTETLYGISLLPRAQQNLIEWDRLAPGFAYYDVTRQDAEHAARLQVALRRRGQQLATVDALIAVIALRNDLILLTTDRDFQAVPFIQVENWLH
jgi:tRNA(fMet)-specific endonuclease VapC